MLLLLPGWLDGVCAAYAHEAAGGTPTDVGLKARSESPGKAKPLEGGRPVLYPGRHRAGR
jgi:hypothetical protein